MQFNLVLKMSMLVSDTSQEITRSVLTGFKISVRTSLQTQVFAFMAVKKMLWYHSRLKLTKIKEEKILSKCDIIIIFIPHFCNLNNNKFLNSW